MGRKLPFFDIDETLMDGKTQKVPESAKKGLLEAHQKGHLIFINTGRCKSFIPACLDGLPIDGFAYGCGSHIEYRGNLLFQELVSYDNFAKLDKTEEKYQLIENGGGFTEILPLPYSKATCMDFLMDYFQIAEEDCYVFGDSPNDLPMLTHIENSIAMGNGYDEVKRVSKYVTGDIDKDGIYQALRHFGLI